MKAYSNIREFVERYIPDNRERLVSPQHARESILKTIDAVASNYRFGGVLQPVEKLGEIETATWYLASDKGIYGSVAIKTSGVYVIKQELEGEVTIQSLLSLTDIEEAIGGVYTKEEVDELLDLKATKTALLELERAIKKDLATKVEVSLKADKTALEEEARQRKEADSKLSEGIANSDKALSAFKEAQSSRDLAQDKALQDAITAQSTIDSEQDKALSDAIEAQSAVDLAQDRVIASKADKLDLDDFKEEQNVINSGQDIEISKTKQELSQIKNSLSTIGQGEIGTAEGGGVISLPENVQSSVAPNYKFEGLTLNQLVKNGDFRDKTVGWAHQGSDWKLNSDGYVEETNAKETLLALHKDNFFWEADVDDKIYVSFYLKVNKAEYIDRIRILIREQGLGGYSIKEDLTYDHPRKYSQIINIKEGKNTKPLNVYRQLFLNESNYEKAVIESKDYMCFNLTQTFGAGNEPSKEWCDANLPDYFEGVKSVQTPMRVKSDVGKHNLLNPDTFFALGKYTIEKLPNNNISVTTEAVSGGYNNWGCGFPVQHPVNIKKGNKITFSAEVKVEKWKSTPITLYFNNQSGSIFRMNTDNMNISEVNKGKWIKVYSTYEAPIDINDIKTLYFYTDDAPIGNKASIRSLKLEISPEPTPWIPYYKLPSETASNLYINNQLELKSVGKVKDYIEDGKLYKNIKRYYFTSKDEWILEEDYEGDNFGYSMVLPFEYKTTGEEDEGELVCNNFTPIGNIGSRYPERDSNTIALWLDNASTVFLTLDKKVDDVNSMIPEGTFIDVILPETEVSNLNTSGLITNHPNGTIFIEPITNLTAFYNDGLDIDKLTIKEVESFSVFKDGNYQDLDVSKISIKGGKLTHPDAIDGLCYLVYRYDDSPIYGVNSVDYYNSDKTLKSPNGKIWKKVERATDDGELEIVLEEVNKEG